jgi:hypothetical protein
MVSRRNASGRDDPGRFALRFAAIARMKASLLPQLGVVACSHLVYPGNIVVGGHQGEITMTAIRVKTHIPESRQVTVTLPLEVPVGDAELEIVVREPTTEFTVTLPPDNRPKVFPSRPTHPALAAEFDAFEAKLPELMKQYAGKYIALHGGEVVAVGNSKTDVLTAAHQQFPGELIYARLVTDQPQPIPRIPSLRAVEETE